MFNDLSPSQGYYKSITFINAFISFTKKKQTIKFKRNKEYYSLFTKQLIIKGQQHHYYTNVINKKKKEEEEEKKKKIIIIVELLKLKLKLKLKFQKDL